MKKFRLEQDFLAIFPNAKIGILICRGIDNTPGDNKRFGGYLMDSSEEAMKYVTNPQFTENAVIADWREAFRAFPTKKGARSSIEAMLKRISKGDDIGTINPLVDIYNGVSLRYGVPVGGEDIDKFEGDVLLTTAEGTEDFVTYGSDKSEPPREGEVVYKDDGGAICRCFNWRESVRTMLTEETTNAFMVIENVGGDGADRLEPALDDLAKMIEERLGGTVEKHIVTAENPEIVIPE